MAGTPSNSRFTQSDADLLYIADSLLDAKGDFIVGTAADTPTRLAVGTTNGMVLEVASGATPGVQWDLPPGHEYAYAETISDTSITASTEATANTIVTAGAVALDGATVVIVDFFSEHVQSPGGGASRFTAIVLYDAVDGGAAASIGLAALVFTDLNGTVHAPCHALRRLTPAVGSHVFSARAYANAGTGVVNGGAGGSGAEAPAFIRVTKV